MDGVLCGAQALVECPSQAGLLERPAVDVNRARMMVPHPIGVETTTGGGVDAAGQGGRWWRTRP